MNAIYMYRWTWSEVKVSLHWYPQLLGNLWSHTLADTVCHRQRSVRNTSLCMLPISSWRIESTETLYHRMLVMSHYLFSKTQKYCYQTCKWKASLVKLIIILYMCTCSCWHSVCFYITWFKDSNGDHELWWWSWTVNNSFFVKQYCTFSFSYYFNRHGCAIFSC